MNSQNSAQIVKKISEQLAPRFEFPEQHAWWILEAITKKNKSTLIIQETVELKEAQQQQLKEWITKLVDEHMPLQYLIGSVPFAGLEILVEPPVLIPRPETEEWCLNLIEQLKTLENQKLAILDMCSGSGCIALALAKALPAAKVYATDISKQAIALGKKNAIHNKITNITFLQSDLFKQLSPSFTFDIIVSNPPYIAESEWHTLDESVTKWEDKRALTAPENGLCLIEQIIKQAAHYIHPNNEMETHHIPQLTIEMGYQQGPVVKALMEQHGFCYAEIKKDLAGKDRIVCGRMPHVATAAD
jgi:release factor glutamine methyltransferase